MTYIYNEYQEAWLRDLETTDALQCAGQLTDGEGFCCLGRAYVANGYNAKRDLFEGMLSSLGLNMAKKLRLRSDLGAFKTPDLIEGAVSLTRLNDHKKFTFKEIAAFIRANPNEVFSG